MKRNLALALGLVVMSGSAFATKARLQALGEDVYGSKYISDNRNIFINAAYINLYKDMVTYEYGDTTSARDQRFGSNNESTGQRAEGGFTKSWGNMVWGLHYGEKSDTANTLRQAPLALCAGGTFQAANAALCTAVGATDIASKVNEQNALSLMIGGDAGLQWGAKLKVSTFEDETYTVGNVKSQSAQANFGIISGDLEAFANISLANSLEIGDVYNVEGKSGYQIGATYNLNGTTVFAEYRAISAEEKDSAVLSEDWSLSKIIVGAGRIQKLNEIANANYKVEYVRDTTENTAYVANDEAVSSKVDVTFGTEVMAKEWLVLRGAITQNLWSKAEDNTIGTTAQRENGEFSIANSTQVRAGASLIFGDLSVDTYVGVAGDDSNGKFSRVSTTYKF